ncbi:fibrinogen-like protein 1-like protein [Microcaecilia unicolor]|uniref:Fibrinogen-like protein 1-like protein n=1 Tax=Microcaecilia unicolor TaxID=1415580 RepID=A0A6P7YNZ5_9AMPH|nr:fibrinogen-like protein 1-like protein [Microcaecilia unicolor]
MVPADKISQLLNVPRGDVYEEFFAKDCQAAYLRGRRQNGLYVISPKEGPLLVVYCLFLEDGGWTVLQRNTGQEDGFWFRTWNDYKVGFGDLESNHWLGNENIYLLTQQNAFAVRFSLTDSEGLNHNADYYSFRVDAESTEYTLRLGAYQGQISDALTVMNETGVHDNRKFSTKDRDNDRYRRNCAVIYKGGWWFDKCGSSDLNSDRGIFWQGVCDMENPCLEDTIMIRPNGKNCNEEGQCLGVESGNVCMRQRSYIAMCAD